MAGRSAGFRHNQTTRDKIRASQLINRLYGHAMADRPTMDASQVNAAKTLLNKVLPDLQSVAHEGGDPDNPIRQRIEQVIVDPKG